MKSRLEDQNEIGIDVLIKAPKRLRCKKYIFYRGFFCFSFFSLFVLFYFPTFIFLFSNFYLSFSNFCFSWFNFFWCGMHACMRHVPCQFPFFVFHIHVSFFHFFIFHVSFSALHFSFSCVMFHYVIFHFFFFSCFMLFFTLHFSSFMCHF